MDLSQLPKMSDTPKPPPPAETATAATAAPAAYREPAGGFGPVAVWISLVIGLLFCMFGANAARWGVAKLSGHEFATGINWTEAAGDRAGTPVGYFELQGGTAWSEVGFFTMGVALLLDAVLLFFVYGSRRPKPLLIGAALAMTGVALAINVGCAGYVFSLGILPFSSMVAVLVGGMMLFEQFGLWREAR